MKKFILFIVCLFISTSVYAGPFIAGGGAGTGDMAEATYSTDGKIKTSKGGTGQDSSAWDGCYPSLDAGIWSCDDNDTRMQRLIGLVIGVDVLAPNGDGSGLSGVVKTESDPSVGAVTGIVSSNGAGVFSAATYADVVGLWTTCSGYLKDDGTCDNPGDNETLINRLIAEGASDNETIESLIRQSHADNNATNSETRSDQSVTPASLAYWSRNALTTRLMAWLAGGTITGLNIGGGNATIDNHGAALFRSVSYIRDTENPFCQQFYAGTNYDDNYTEVCAPPTGYSETYRLYWPTTAPTGDQVMVFPAPTLGVSQGTWQDLAGGGDLVSTNNLSDIDNATAARRNLGLEIGVDVSAPVTSTEPIINIALRGGGSAISTGSAGNKRIAAAATITGYTITSSASCSITVDLWKTTYTAYDVSTHPVDGDSITASAPITLTTAVKAKDETLTDWTTTLAADDIIHVNVDSADCTGDVDIQVYGTRSL